MATAQKRLNRLTAALQELEGLKVELDGERPKAKELEERLHNYEETYDYLQAEFEDHKDQFDNVIDFVNRFHEINQPVIFKKRWVKNEKHGKSYTLSLVF